MAPARTAVAYMLDALTFRHWGRQPLRTLLVVAAIALGVAGTIAARLTGTYADRALRATIFGPSTEASLQIVGLNGSVESALVPLLGAVPGIAQVRPELAGNVALHAPQTARVSAVRMEGIDALQTFPGSDRLRSYAPGPFGPPQRFDLAMTAGRGVVVSGLFARELALVPGSRVDALAGGTSTVLCVAGVASPLPLGMDPHAVFVDIATADAVLRARGALSRIDLVLLPGAHAADVEGNVAKLLAPRVHVVEPERRLAAFE